jgi:hypothetical protein
MFALVMRPAAGCIGVVAVGATRLVKNKEQRTNQMSNPLSATHKRVDT